MNLLAFKKQKCGIALFSANVRMVGSFLTWGGDADTGSDVTRCGIGRDGGELLPWAPPDLQTRWVSQGTGGRAVTLLFSLATSSPPRPVLWAASFLAHCGYGFRCSLQLGRICILNVPLGKVKTPIRLSFEADRLMFHWNSRGTRCLQPERAWKL